MQKKSFVAPRIEDLGAMAELTKAGFSGQVGMGGGMGGPAS